MHYRICTPPTKLSHDIQTNIALMRGLQSPNPAFHLRLFQYTVDAEKARERENMTFNHCVPVIPCSLERGLDSTEFTLCCRLSAGVSRTGRGMKRGSSTGNDQRLLMLGVKRGMDFRPLGVNRREHILCGGAIQQLSGCVPTQCRLRPLKLACAFIFCLRGHCRQVQSKSLTSHSNSFQICCS